jgi:hypothetical protein
MMKAPIFCVICFLIATIINNQATSLYESPVRNSPGSFAAISGNR